ncbi:MAG: glycosyltransferase family 1 protein [Actinobacteria bacterium]|nr:glycosyltransferase family 1 protein [Actinomycetota bacterium]
MPLAVLAGPIANKPRNGGEAWVRLNWLLGLRRLGWEVLFVEVVPGSPEPAALAHLEAAMEAHGFGDDWALLDGRGRSMAGRPSEEVEALAAEAEVLFNHSGHLGPGPVRDSPRLRVYVDLDPAYTQVWAADPALAFSVAGHDRHVTVGLGVGAEGCPLPSAGVDWIPTLPPVVLEHWPAAPPPDRGPLRFTTVSTWRGAYGPLEVAGEVAGGKHHEFRRMSALPGRVSGATFELALDIHPGDAADLDALRGAGWSVVDPGAVASTPAGFGAYVRASDAEFSVAQGAYVASRSGWFSDRSAAYLASGRPVLVQDTGVGRRLPVGEGLVTFADLAGAEAGARRLVADPIGHGEAARELARAHLDSDLVLGGLLERLGLGAGVA